MGRMWCHSLTSMLFHSVLFSSLFCSFLFSVELPFSPFSSSCHPLHALFLCLCGRGTPVCLFTFHLFTSSFICPLSLSLSLSLSPPVSPSTRSSSVCVGAEHLSVCLHSPSPPPPLFVLSLSLSLSLSL